MKYRISDLLIEKFSPSGILLQEFFIDAYSNCSQQHPWQHKQPASLCSQSTVTLLHAALVTPLLSFRYCQKEKDSQETDP